jgi:hypothetical protein
MAAVRGDRPARGSLNGGAALEDAPVVADDAPVVADDDSVADCRAPQFAQNTSLPFACWPHCVQKGIL